jgi:hypothetical protein
VHRKHGCNWYHDLPPAALATMLGRQRSELKKLREKCDAEHHNGDVPSKAAIKAGQEEACAHGVCGALCAVAVVWMLKTLSESLENSVQSIQKASRRPGG